MLIDLPNFLNLTVSTGPVSIHGRFSVNENDIEMSVTHFY